MANAVRAVSLFVHLTPPPGLLAGTNCQAEIDECEDHPCQNGATCWDHVAAYSCQCVAGFQGLDCELDIDECASAPCLNEGACIDGINRWALTLTLPT